MEYPEPRPGTAAAGPNGSTYKSGIRMGTMTEHDETSLVSGEVIEQIQLVIAVEILVSVCG